MKVIAIDPGTEDSAMVVMDAETLKPEQLYLETNDMIRYLLYNFPYSWDDEVAIEMVASYGMPVGREVFETCVWIGRFYEAAVTSLKNGNRPQFVYRKDEKLHICQSPKANDATIRRALIDRFADHDLRFGRGTKKDPDWFYGFRQDLWAAYAVGLTYVETMMRAEK